MHHGEAWPKWGLDWMGHRAQAQENPHTAIGNNKKKQRLSSVKGYNTLVSIFVVNEDSEATKFPSCAVEQNQPLTFLPFEQSKGLLLLKELLLLTIVYISYIT